MGQPALSHFCYMAVFVLRQLCGPRAAAVAALCAAVLLMPARAQTSQESKLDSSPALFSVMAAINAAGYDTDVNSTANSPARRMVREAIAARHPEVLPELKQFYTEHFQTNPTANLNQYISFALSVDGPPNFHWRVPEAEVPPDAMKLQGFELLLQRLNREANLEDLWRKVQPEYEETIARYHGPVSRALLEVNGYMRNATSGYLGRRFAIYVDLLTEPYQVQSRSYKDDYFVVVTPAPEPQMADIRHAYLHYLLDPLALKYADPLNRLKPIAEYAEAAPALPDAYKQDYVLLATECFIKAVEARLSPASERAHRIGDALRQGYVLTAAFADALPAFEKQAVTMRLYFRDLVQSIDLNKEEARLSKVEFAKSPEVKIVRTPPPAVDPVQKTLEEAQQLSAGRASTPEELERARKLFRSVLEQTTDPSAHARAYYGLARIAALNRDPALAEQMFLKTLDFAPDAATRAWTYVYLGRLADAAGEHAQAEKRYRAALGVEKAPDEARSAAQKGLAKPN